MKEIKIKDIKKGQVFHEYGYGRYATVVARTDAYCKNGGWQVFGTTLSNPNASIKDCIRFYVRHGHPHYGPRLFTLDRIQFYYPKGGRGSLKRRDIYKIGETAQIITGLEEGKIKTFSKDKIVYNLNTPKAPALDLTVGAYVEFDYPHHGQGPLIKRKGVIEKVLDYTVGVKGDDGRYKNFLIAKIQNFEKFEDVEINLEEFDRDTLIKLLVMSIDKQLPVDKVVVGLIEAFINKHDSPSK